MGVILSRRSLLGLASAATAAAALPSFLIAAPAQGAQPSSRIRANASALRPSAARAVFFLDFMMDAYATGSTIRLTQSYSDEALGATAFTYDNAVTIHAYLAVHSDAATQRAEVLGMGLLYAQAHNFPFNDGRFAQAYYVNVPDANGAYITPAAAPFYFYTSAVGDQAWAGMALAQLYLRTGKSVYLAGALSVANWIVTNTYNTQGPGGYSFGTNINQYNQSVPSGNGKSTEHNIDAYAFFTMLSKLTGGGFAINGMSWSDLALHALQFVTAMYNSAGPCFFVGTLPDQVSTNYYPVAEDCQTWSYMATLSDSWDGTVDWALANLQATDTAASPHSSLTGSQKITGMVFDSASLNTPVDDPNAVWLEGTGQMIAALGARARHDQDGVASQHADLTEAIYLLKQCELAQFWLGTNKTAGGHPIPQGYGLVAATSILDTGFGYSYGPSLHIAATGWYVLGGLAANPFQLGFL